MKRGSYMIWEDVQVLRHNTRAHNRIVLFQKGMSTLAASHVSITLPLTRNWNGEGNGTPLQYPCLENHMGGGACWAAVHGVTRSRTWLSDFTFTFHFNALEKETATHSSVLAWRIPGKGEPGGLPSMGSHRVGHDWSDLAAAAAGIGRDFGFLQ